MTIPLQISSVNSMAISTDLFFFLDRKKYYCMICTHNSGDCVFCRIIEPLASRCAKFRFKPLPEEIMSNRILHICNEEGLTLDTEVCKACHVHSYFFSGLIS